MVRASIVCQPPVSDRPDGTQLGLCLGQVPFQSGLAAVALTVLLLRLPRTVFTVVLHSIVCVTVVALHSSHCGCVWQCSLCIDAVTSCGCTVMVRLLCLTAQRMHGGYSDKVDCGCVTVLVTMVHNVYYCGCTSRVHWGCISQCSPWIVGDLTVGCVAQCH